jgi:hypothetical protein
MNARGWQAPLLENGFFRPPGNELNRVSEDDQRQKTDSKTPGPPGTWLTSPADWARMNMPRMVDRASPLAGGGQRQCQEDLMGREEPDIVKNILKMVGR